MLIGQQQTPDFRLGVSLICPFYIDNEEWIGKNLYYGKINIKNIKREYERISERISRYIYNKQYIHIFDNSVQINNKFTSIVT